MHSITHGIILSQLMQEYAPIVSHHQRKSLSITQSHSENDLILCGTTLSQVIKEYVPVVSHHQSKSLPVTKSLNT